MIHNFFQDGGEDPTGASFFNGLLDMGSQQSDTEDYQDEQNPNNESETNNSFIDSLSQYADETNNNDLQSQIDELKSQLALTKHEDYLNSIQDDLEQQIAIAQYYQTPDGEDDLMSKYENKPVTPNYNSGPKYTPVETPTNSSVAGRNNPGNVRDLTTGKFKSFATPQEGSNALINQLNLYRTGKTRTGLKPTSTLYQAMAKYAPASDRNDPKHYAEFIASKMGISPNTPISQIDPKGWADAIRIMEGNKNVDKMKMGGYTATFQGGRMGIKPHSKTKKYMC